MSFDKFVADDIGFGACCSIVGETCAVKFQVVSQLLQDFNNKGHTTLKLIEDCRIRELIIEDLRIYKRSAIRDINQRIGL